ncbi:MAG: DNA-deoxyinosine glycosylase [Chlorobiaceae bacterium]|nr:DNA-deoxyinosine glycosylase [Chlorobiaceae bacterium]
MADCFEPVARADARVLVLGSVPGEESIRQQRYYGHGRNAFWPLMERLLGDGSSLDYPARLALLMDSGIALWDVLASATRTGSLDSAIVAGSEVPNDIVGFLDSHPKITHIFFNGAKAEESFKRHNGKRITDGRVQLVRLPSTSPANAAINFDAKLQAWIVVVDTARVVGAV